MADFLGMLKQAAQLQSKMQAMQDELGHVEVEGISGGGLVTVRMTAKMEVKAVKIDPSLMKADEHEILEDLALVRPDQRGVDLDRLHFHLRGHAHADETAARDALDLDVAELFLHRLHLRLQLRRLFHHAEKISHQTSF